jgi:hypothetical protein
MGLSRPVMGLLYLYILYKSACFFYVQKIAGKSEIPKYFDKRKICFYERTESKINGRHVNSTFLKEAVTDPDNSAEM